MALRVSWFSTFDAGQNFSFGSSEDCFKVPLILNIRTSGQGNYSFTGCSQSSGSNLDEISDTAI